MHQAIMVGSTLVIAAVNVWIGEMETILRFFQGLPWPISLSSVHYVLGQAQ